MLYLRYLLIVFAAVLLEGTVGSRIAIHGIAPDVSLAVVVLAGLWSGARIGVLVGFLIGLLRGCVDPEWMGLEALLLSIVGFAAGSTSPMVNRRSGIMQGLLIAGLLLAHDLVRALVISGFSPADAFSLWIGASPGTALYTAIIVPLAIAWIPRIWSRRGAYGRP